MTVSEHDRDYFRRLGAIKARTHGDAAADHGALSLAKRLEQSWALYLAYRQHSARRDYDDAAAAFYDRARALGLYRVEP